MFERFSPGARAVVVEAQSHARRLHHRSIGTEHLLLALLTNRGDVARVLEERGCTVEVVERALAERVGTSPEDDREALAALGIDLDRVRAAADAQFGEGALADVADRPRRRSRRWRRRATHAPGPPPGHIPFSTPAKSVLELALREALRLHHQVIDAEHVALGLLRDRSGLARTALVDAGLDIDEVRAAIECSLRRAA